MHAHSFLALRRSTERDAPAASYRGKDGLIRGADRLHFRLHECPFFSFPLAGYIVFSFFQNSFFNRQILKILSSKYKLDFVLTYALYTLGTREKYRLTITTHPFTRAFSSVHLCSRICTRWPFFLSICSGSFSVELVPTTVYPPQGRFRTQACATSRNTPPCFYQKTVFTHALV